MASSKRRGRWPTSFTASACTVRMKRRRCARQASGHRCSCLGPVDERDRALALENEAALTVWNRRFAAELSRLASARGRPFPIHVKVDTGVTRLGFDVPAATAGAGCTLGRRRPCRTGDIHSPRGRRRTRIRVHARPAGPLRSCVEAAGRRARRRRRPAACRRIGGRHAVSGAAARPGSAGIATYGIWPSPQTRAAADYGSNWSPRCRGRRARRRARRRRRPPVGYGCTFVTARASRIGVLPIGYAEGLPRALSNAGVALLNGKRVPFVGRICMNMSFIDVTDVPDACRASTVTLIGRDGAECSTRTISRLPRARSATRSSLAYRPTCRAATSTDPKASRRRCSFRPASGRRPAASNPKRRHRVRAAARTDVAAGRRTVGGAA